MPTSSAETREPTTVDEITQVAFSAYALAHAIPEPEEPALVLRRMAMECAERLAIRAPSSADNAAPEHGPWAIPARCLSAEIRAENAGGEDDADRDYTEDWPNIPTTCGFCGFVGTMAGPYHDCKGGTAVTVSYGKATSVGLNTRTPERSGAGELREKIAEELVALVHPECHLVGELEKPMPGEHTFGPSCMTCLVAADRILALLRDPALPGEEETELDEDRRDYGSPL